MGLDLSQISTGALRGLRTRLAGGRLADPLSSRDAGAVSALVGLPCAEAAQVLDAVLAERAQQVPSPDVVWTGPGPVNAAVRDTAVTLRQMFGRAQHRVLVAGYSVDHGAQIFAPLHRGMVERGLTVDLFLNVPIADADRSKTSEGQQAVVGAWMSRFLATNWPGPPYPALHYDPRTVSTTIYASQHAKCVVVDEREALVTSANFTQRGQIRNVEAGALITDPRFARALFAQWRGALAHGMFVTWAG